MPEPKDRLGNLEDGVPQPYDPEKYPPDPRRKPRNEAARGVKNTTDRTLEWAGMLNSSGKVKGRVIK